MKSTILLFALLIIAGCQSTPVDGPIVVKIGRNWDCPECYPESGGE